MTKSSNLYDEIDMRKESIDIAPPDAKGVGRDRYCAERS